jgi:hypothetical protein
MKIRELFVEQAVGTTGSTSGFTTPVSQVQPVSQNPATNSSTQTPNPQTQQLTALLKQNKVIDNEKQMNDFMSAYDASSQQRTLNPAQQDLMGKLSGPLMKDPSLASKIKLLAVQKPGTMPVGSSTPKAG